MTEQEKQPGRRRIMALDVGSRRIGIAVTDELGLTAQGLETLVRTRKRDDLAALTKLARRLYVKEIVVGDPIRMSGEASTQSEKVAVFAQELRAASGIPVVKWDERLTSAEANRLLDEAGKTRLERKGVVDQMAAILILQAFMQARASRAENNPYGTDHS